MKLKRHVGVVFEPSERGFDEDAASFGCVFEDPSEMSSYLYFTGASGAKEGKWRKAAIGIAKSKDGINFSRCSKDPAVSVGVECVTPAVFTASGKYWMAFSFKTRRFLQGRRLGIASAEKPTGPWKFMKQLLAPKMAWEGNSIDLGPSTGQLNDEHLLFYSNVGLFYARDARGLLKSWLGKSTPLRRRIGLLKLKVSDSAGVTSERWIDNPFSHLNGERGSWNESLFCPGYVELGERHYLFPAGSTYSAGHPYKQYIGLIEDSSQFFSRPTGMRILINGPEDRREILSKIEGEIALDTPCPIVKGNEVWIYYAAMDRADGVWKTALSIFSKP